LTAEQQLILSVLGRCLRGQTIREMPAENATQWSLVEKESRAHAVPLQVFYGIDHLKSRIPEQAYNKMFETARRCVAHNIRTDYLQQQLVAVLEQECCPYVILKGKAAAAYYPVPEHRQLGDVDFWVPEEWAQRIVDIFIERGFTHSTEQDEHHQILHRGKDHMELHIEPAGIPKGEAGAAVRAYLSTVFQRRRKADGEMGSFYVPDHAHHGLILLLHMQHHMTGTGMGLRHLMDWACFVEKTRQEPFWQEQLLPLLKQIGLLYYCVALTKTCCIYFEQECPSWACDGDDQLCQQLMEDLLLGGNFGRKNKERARSTMMLPDQKTDDKQKGKLALLLGTLRKAVIRENPTLEQKTVARMLAMLYKACRYLVLRCAGKRPSLLKVMSHADQRRYVYDQLKIFETE